VQTRYRGKVVHAATFRALAPPTCTTMADAVFAARAVLAEAEASPWWRAGEDAAPEPVESAARTASDVAHIAFALAPAGARHFAGVLNAPGRAAREIVLCALRRYGAVLVLLPDGGAPADATAALNGARLAQIASDALLNALSSQEGDAAHRRSALLRAVLDAVAAATPLALPGEPAPAPTTRAAVVAAVSAALVMHAARLTGELAELLGGALLAPAGTPPLCVELLGGPQFSQASKDAVYAVVRHGAAGPGAPAYAIVDLAADNVQSCASLDAAMDAQSARVAAAAAAGAPHPEVHIVHVHHTPEERQQMGWARA
jgi:hypothetical protein